MSRIRIKVCGICTAGDAATAVRAGADAIGMVFYPESPRFLSISQARDITSRMPPFVSAVGLFVNSSYQEVCAVLSEVKLELLQFHGDEDEAFCDSFDLPYIKALRVKAGTDLYEQCRRYDSARGVLLDSYKKGVPGGTGETFDWDLIPHDLPLPVILAGGLNSNNVKQAIRTIKPWAVDVSSGVEKSPGKKDPEKITQFINEAGSLSNN